MGTFLFDKTIFGPISSRRFGDSLGINLLPNDYKLCNLDCVYCECGWTLTPDKKVELPTYDEVAEEFENYLIKIKSEKVNVDSFTFAGNGEPTVHPDFPRIIDLTLRLRDKYYPKANVSIYKIWGVKKQNTVFAVGKSIINKSSKVNIGEIMYKYNGGGHIEAGSCQVPNEFADIVLKDLIETLKEPTLVEA